MSLDMWVKEYRIIVDKMVDGKIKRIITEKRQREEFAVMCARRYKNDGYMVRIEVVHTISGWEE